jgi:hypothetical protein
MKINWFLACIALIIAGLIAFGFYSGNLGGSYRLLITIGSGISFLITLCGILALSSDHGGTVNIKVTSVLFFIGLLIEHIIFSFAGIRLTPYIIITGILILLYVLICYAVMRALK